MGIETEVDALMSAADDAKKLAKDRITIERELVLRGSMRDYVRLAWPVAEPGTAFRDNWHIGAMCEHLQAVTAGQIRHLCINVPPGCMKSRLTGLFWPTWSWIRDGATTRWGGWSFDQDLVYREAGDSLELIRSEWFRSRWGARVTIKDRAPAIGEYWSTAGGLRFSSTTPKGDATGWHFDYWVIDDPHKPQTISKVTLEESRRWWYGTLQTRKKDPATLRAVMVMQRLHENDLAGWAERDGYVMLRIPMRFEPKALSVTPIGFTDPRGEAGDLLWPDRFPESEVRSLEQKLGPSGVASQLQQRPAPEGGAVFRKEWFRTWVRRGTATEHLAPGTWKELPEDFDEIIQSWDCTFKDTDGSDYVVGQVWGRKGGDFFLLDELQKRMSFAGTCEAILDMSTRWPTARPILIEDKANGPAVVSTLKEEVHGIEAVDPEGGKMSRANATTGAYFAGNVYHPDPLVYTWVHDHRSELASFPFGANDDRVDAMSQALIFLMQRFRAFGEAMKKFGKVIVPDAETPATVEEQKDVGEMLELLYGLQRVL